MNLQKIGYWAITGLGALAFAGGGAADLSQSPEMLAGMAQVPAVGHVLASSPTLPVRRFSERPIG